MSMMNKYYKSKRQCLPLSAESKAVDELQTTLAKLGDSNRPNFGYRVQGQIILTPGRSNNVVDACVLRVLNTAVYNKFLAFLTNWQDGLAGARSSSEHASPVFLPPWLQDEDNLHTLNAIITAAYDAYPEGEQSGGWRPEQVSRVDYDSFIRRVCANWDRLAMPPAHERPRVRIIRPQAPCGSLVLWTGYHGNTAALEPPRPCVSVFVDYADRRTFGADLLEESYQKIATAPWQIGAGSSATRHAGNNHESNQIHHRLGGLARLGDAVTPTIRYLVGERAPAPADVPTDVLSEEQIKLLHDQAYLVITPEQMRRLNPDWPKLINGAVDDLSEYMNDVIININQLEDQDDFDLRNRPDDPRLAAVGGTCKDAERLLGDRYAMYRRKADGSRVKNAQSGGSLLTAQSGMGAAANLYDSPNALLLQASTYPIFAQLYQTVELTMLPERFRIRTGAAGELAIHTDTRVRY